MATDNESFNRDLYNLLKVRGYDPVPLDSKNQRVPASQASDVIQFTFTKDGEDYGKAWVTIDDAKNVIVYYDEEQQESPSSVTPGVEYNDSWTGFLTHLKNWAQRRQLSFELANKDRLSDDMRQRDYYKMKERVSESYHSMGKKASYNDAVPNVKIVLQHNRALEEGEQRYRNVARIFLENADGERFLAPTTRPGIARVYARHIAEGGVPNDDRWNHIKSVCEDYNKMAGFVRATRNKEFSESAHQLVQEGANHYSNLRETLSKLAGHRGYHAYFESWTPSLMEDEGDDLSINELFVQETVDPRIESVMPILSKLRKNVAEMSEVDTLAEWADSIISEKLELEEEQVDENFINMAPQAVAEEEIDETSDQYKIDYLKKTSGGEPHPNPIKRMMGKKYPRSVPDLADKGRAAFTKKIINNISGKKWDDEQQADLEKTLGKHSQRNNNMVNVAKRMGYDLEEAERNQYTGDISGKDYSLEKDKSNRWVYKDKTGMPKVSRDTATQAYKAGKNYKSPVAEEEVEEGLDANQKRVGQLGPTEKVKNNNIGKLVGASESTEIDPALARIMEMARFKR